jgi:hypothetical protein
MLMGHRYYSNCFFFNYKYSLEILLQFFKSGSPFQRDGGIWRGQHSHVQVHIWHHGSRSPRFRTGFFS